MLDDLVELGVQTELHTGGFEVSPERVLVVAAISLNKFLDRLEMAALHSQNTALKSRVALRACSTILLDMLEARLNKEQVRSVAAAVVVIVVFAQVIDVL